MSEMFFEPDIFNAFIFNKIPVYENHENPAGKTCPVCRSSFIGIAQSGRAGCGRCYETFKSEFAPNVIRIHGTVNHAGKIPRGRSVQINAKRKIGQLGAQLKKMIDEQNFEEAAVIRDEINALKKEVQNS